MASRLAGVDRKVIAALGMFVLTGHMEVLPAAEVPQWAPIYLLAVVALFVYAGSDDLNWLIDRVTGGQKPEAATDGGERR